MSATDTNWPDYINGMDDWLHALGVAAFNYNNLEYRLLGLHLLFSDYVDADAVWFAKNKNTRIRLKKLRENVDVRCQHRDIRKAVHHFCDCFEVAATNRNVLMHSGITTVIEDGEITQAVLNKGDLKDAIDWERYFFTIGRMRDVVDELHVLNLFGKRLHDYALLKQRNDLAIKSSVNRFQTTIPTLPPLQDSNAIASTDIRRKYDTRIQSDQGIFGAEISRLKGRRRVFVWFRMRIFIRYSWSHLPRLASHRSSTQSHVAWP